MATLPKPPAVPRKKHLGATRKKNKVHIDCEDEEERQETQQPSLNTKSTSTRLLDLGGSRLSRGSTSASWNQGSETHPRIGIVADMIAADNLPKTGDNDDDKTMGSDGQRVETSKNGNPGKMKVDCIGSKNFWALKVLHPHRLFC